MKKTAYILVFLTVLGLIAFSIQYKKTNRSISSFDNDECIKFFDNIDNPVKTKITINYSKNIVQVGKGDVSPAPIQISSLDSDILKVCGEWGHEVREQDLALLIQKHPEIYSDFESYLRQNNVNIKEYIKSIWFNHRAFQHIFCGEPKGTKIGGLHFWARYYELQRKGKICLMPNNPNQHLLPDNVYTVGVISREGTDALKGYAISQSSLDIFKQATSEYLRICEKGNFSPIKQQEYSKYKVCKLPHTSKLYYSQYVCNPGEGIVTMYPLASQSGQGDICR